MGTIEKFFSFDEEVEMDDDGFAVVGKKGRSNVKKGPQTNVQEPVKAEIVNAQVEPKIEQPQTEVDLNNMSKTQLKKYRRALEQQKKENEPIQEQKLEPKKQESKKQNQKQQPKKQQKQLAKESDTPVVEVKQEAAEDVLDDFLLQLIPDFESLPQQKKQQLLKENIDRLANQVERKQRESERLRENLHRKTVLVKKQQKQIVKTDAQIDQLSAINRQVKDQSKSKGSQENQDKSENLSVPKIDLNGALQHAKQLRQNLDKKKASLVQLESKLVPAN